MEQVYGKPHTCFLMLMSYLNLLSLLALVCKLGKAMCLHPRGAAKIEHNKALSVFNRVYRRGWQYFSAKRQIVNIFGVVGQVSMSSTLEQLFS